MAVLLHVSYIDGYIFLRFSNVQVIIYHALIIILRVLLLTKSRLYLQYFQNILAKEVYFIYQILKIN